MTSTSSRRDFLRYSAAAAAVVGAGGLIAACGDDDDSGSGTTTTAGDGTTAGAADLKPLTVMMPFPLSPNFIADVAGVSGGYFEKEGLDVKVEFATGAPQALQQLAGGNVTVVRNGPVETVQAQVDQDAPFITIGMPNQRTNYTLVSLPDAALTMADLADKTVGLPSLGGNAEVTLDVMLRDAGVDPASVQRQATGLEASAYGVLQEGVVDALLVPRSTVAGIQAMDEDPHVEYLEDENPLLGTNLVTTTEYAQDRRDVIVLYLAGLHAVMTDLNDPEKVPGLVDQVLADGWELPMLQDPEAAQRIVAAIATRWFEDGEENLLRNIPERWEEGISGLAEQDLVPADTDPTTLYTNDLLDEALA